MMDLEVVGVDDFSLFGVVKPGMTGMSPDEPASSMYIAGTELDGRDLPRYVPGPGVPVIDLANTFLPESLDLIPPMRSVTCEEHFIEIQLDADVDVIRNVTEGTVSAGVKSPRDDSRRVDMNPSVAQQIGSTVGTPCVCHDDDICSLCRFRVSSNVILLVLRHRVDGNPWSLHVLSCLLTVKVYYPMLSTSW